MVATLAMTETISARLAMITVGLWYQGLAFFSPCTAEVVEESAGMVAEPFGAEDSCKADCPCGADGSSLSFISLLCPLEHETHGLMTH
jgi:hypothetical protein